MCFYDGGDCVGMNFLCYTQNLRNFPRAVYEYFCRKFGIQNVFLHCMEKKFSTLYGKEVD